MGVQALTTLMEQQQVTYEFTVYSLPMPVDVPVTILTVGRSLLHTAVDLELPLNAAGKLARLGFTVVSVSLSCRSGKA